jgi:hypothetical protein
VPVEAVLRDLLAVATVLEVAGRAGVRFHLTVDP